MVEPGAWLAVTEGKGSCCGSAGRECFPSLFAGDMFTMSPRQMPQAVVARVCFRNAERRIWIVKEQAVIYTKTSNIVHNNSRRHKGHALGVCIKFHMTSGPTTTEQRVQLFTKYSSLLTGILTPPPQKREDARPT